MELSMERRNEQTRLLKLLTTFGQNIAGLSRATCHLTQTSTQAIIASNIRASFEASGCIGEDVMNRWKSTTVTVARIAGTMLVGFWATAANAQNCGHWMQLKAEAAGAGNLQLLYQYDAEYHRCLNSGPSTTYVPTTPHFNPTYQPPQSNSIYNNPISRAWEQLGQRVMAGQPLRQNIPLSSGLVRQEIYVPPPPSNYGDPFAARVITPSRPSKPFDPNANNCGPNTRIVVRGSFTFCELYMERPPN